LTTLVIIVTAAMRASRRPVMVARVLSQIDWSARMLPFISAFPSRVAEDPTCLYEYVIIIGVYMSVCIIIWI
jgi:hypothetical protein